MIKTSSKPDRDNKYQSPEEAYARVYHCALGLLARREHSVTELYGKLALRGFDRVFIADVIDTVIEEGSLSESRFTEAYIHSRASKGYGPARIKAELRERGITSCDVELAAEAINKSWNECAAQVRMKRFGPDAPDDFHEKARQMRFLGQRGFIHDQIQSAFEYLPLVKKAVASRL